MYLNYRLPDIPVNPIPYPDFFLLAYMCIFSCITDSKETGEFISNGSINEMFHVLRFIANGNTESTRQSFRRCC